jgi:hypothetical protein
MGWFSFINIRIPSVQMIECATPLLLSVWTFGMSDFLLLSGRWGSLSPAVEVNAHQESVLSDTGMNQTRFRKLFGA